MSQQPVEANVVLTADNSGYDQAMQQSTQSTNSLGKSIDGLGDKINKLTKSAGKKLLGITAADVALITGATAAWASYEKQMSKLSAQAAIVGRGREAEQRTMKSYTESVKSMRKEFGTTTSEAAELTKTIAKMADQTRSVKSLGTVFTEMSHATGESSQGLASSVLNLQKVMGTPQSATRQYTDQLTTLAAKSNTSATALADFSSQIAPMGRAMGMSQKQVIGFANMFTKAGQDGIAASSAFTKVSADITQAVQTGSPELNKYARLLGVSTKQFTEMGAAEQVGGFFDQIAKMGPRASQELNRFGLDGIRMSKSIIQTVQASGGAMNALREGNAAYGSGSTKEGSDAAETLSTVLAKLRQQVQMTAEEFGKAFGPGIMVVVKGVEFFAGVMEDLMDGPLGKFLQVVAAIIIPVTAAAGVFLLMAKAVMGVSAAFAVLKSSPMMGVKEGLQGFQRINPELDAAGAGTGRFIAGAAPGGRQGVLGKAGADVAERGSWLMRGGYNRGQEVGGGIRRTFGWLGGVGTDRDAEGVARQANIWKRGTIGGINLAGRWGRQGFDQMLYDPGDRDIGFRQNFMDKGPATAGELARGQYRPSMFSTPMGQKQMALPTSMSQFRQMIAPITGAGVKPKVDVDAAAGAAKDAKAASEAAAANVKATKGSTAAIAANVAVTQHATAQTGKEVTVKGALVKESGKFAGTLAKAEVELVKFGASVAGSGAARGLKAAGSGLVGALGGPWGAAITGGMMLTSLIPVFKDMFTKEKHEYEYKQLGTPGTPYLETAGVQQEGAPEVVPGQERAKPTMAQARRVGKAKAAIAKSQAHTLADKSMYGLNEKQVTAYLGATFDKYKDDPEAMDQLSLDLADKFDGPTANRIIKNLYQGEGLGDSSTILKAAAGTSGKQKETLLNVAMSMAKEEEAQGWKKGSAEGLFRAKAKTTTKLFRAVAGGDEDQLEALNKQYGTNYSSKDFQQKRLESTIEQQPMLGYAGAPAGEQGASIVAPPQQKAQGTGGKALPDFDKMSTAEQLKYQMTEFGSKKQQREAKQSFGIDPDATGKQLSKDIHEALTGKLRPATDSTEALRKQMEGMGGFATMLATDKKAQDAIGHYGANIEDNLKTVDRIFARARKNGASMSDVVGDMQKVRSKVADETKPESIVATFVQQQAQQQEALKMPTMTRGQAFQSQVNTFQAAVQAKPTTDVQRQEQEQAKANMAGAISDQVNYFRQMLIMQDNYDKQRKRAQEDFTLSRQWAEEDFNIQRQQAEDAFNRQRKRAIEDFHRNEARAYFGFHLQRKRAEEDFNHSVNQMAKQQAMSIYDIYKRVQTQRTVSAEWLLSNAGDQLKRMQEQESNLDKVRKAGLSDTAIQQLKLTDPNNAQQLGRFVTEMTPALIAQFNKTAGKERVKAAKSLVTDESSAEWKEMRRGFRLQMSRGAEDFERQMKQGRQDFKRGLGVQRDEFKISMDQQLASYKRGQDHQLTQFHTMQKRAAKDMADTARELNMSLDEVLAEGGRRLTGAAGRQVRQVSRAYTDLKNDTSPAAIEIMKQLADIFGFEYKVPKGVSTGHKDKKDDTGTGANNPAKPHSPLPGHGGNAAGGVLPGYTPGRDVHHFTSPTGGELHLSGGEAVMVPEWTRAMGGEKGVKEMNRAARQGHGWGNVARWMGGTLPLAGAHASQHTSGYGFARWAGDLNAGSGYDDYGKPVHPWKAGKVAQHNFVGDRSYGRWVIVNHAGGQSTLYAHLSKFGAPTGTQVTPGSTIGYVGALGNTGNPPTSHLHFEIRGGNVDMGDTGAGAVGAAGASVGIDPRSVLQQRYKRAEKAAFNMDGTHPLWPGDISHVINRMARRKLNTLIKKYGDPSATQAGMGMGFNLDPGTAYGANAHGVWTALLASGLSKIQTAGVMGNMQSESGFDPFIVQGGGHSMNPAAAGGGGYGLVQWTPGRKLIPYLHGHRPSVATEVNALREQLAGRGSSPEGSAGAALRGARTIAEAARAFELRYERHAGGPQANRISQAHAIYDKYAANGAIVNGAQQLTVGEAGPEAVIPLNERGAEFMADVMAHTMGGRQMSPGGRSVSIYNTHVDKSTNFNGPITVTANNPHELINKLKSRQRVMAMTRPALTGSAA